MMMDWLISLLVPLTFLLFILLLCHRFFMSTIGVKNTYTLWLVIPLGLILFNLPLSWLAATSITNNEIQQFIVTPTQVLQQSLTESWLIVLWLIISSTMVGYWLISHFLFKEQLNLQSLTSITGMKNSISIELPISLELYQSSHAYSPMLLGVFKQRLILPEDFTQLYNDEQQQLILEHEVCHFQRNDIYWNMVAFFLLALFWFHPLVWIAYFRFRRDQELSCDHIVLAKKQCTSRLNYSKALLITAETAPPLAFAQLSFKKYGDKEIMFERIKEIKLNTKASKLSLSLMSALSICLLSGLSYAGNMSANDKVNKVQQQQQQFDLMPIYRIEPKYPLKAAQENTEGSVVLKFDVNLAGKVENVSVIKAIPKQTFNKVATTALLQWQYAAKGKYYKNLLVQLDFRMDENSTFEDIVLIEKIKVTQQ